MYNQKRKIELIFGKTGTGKTTLAKKIIENYNRVIIIDALQEYKKGLIFYSFQDLADYFTEKNPSKFNFICRFENDLDMEYLFLFIFEIGNLLLVVEEAEIYIAPQVKQSSFLRLVRYGRHRGISILGIARRSTELSTSFRSQTDKIYSFKQTDPLDLKKMELLGFYNLAQLPQFKYITKEY